MKMITKGAIT